MRPARFNSDIAGSGEDCFLCIATIVGGASDIGFEAHFGSLTDIIKVERARHRTDASSQKPASATA